jgi:hypothetical protein
MPSLRRAEDVFDDLEILRDSGDPDGLGTEGADGDADAGVFRHVVAAEVRLFGLDR